MQLLVLYGILAAVAQAKVNTLSRSMKTELSVDAEANIHQEQVKQQTATGLTRRAGGGAALSVDAEANIHQEEASDDADEEDADVGEQEALSSDQMRSIHEEADQDQNGKLSMDEALGYSQMMREIKAIKEVHQALGEMDESQDGKISFTELLNHINQWGTQGNDEVKAYAEKKRDEEKAKFKEADQDNNGVLDSEELPAFLHPDSHDYYVQMTGRATVKALDKDGDLELSPEEFGPIDDEDLSFSMIDADASGKLDLDEVIEWRSGRVQAEQAMKKLFEVADKDHDGMLSADELEASKEFIAGTNAQYHLMEWAEHGDFGA